MPRADGTFYNSWDMAKSKEGHGGPWISTTDRGYRNKVHAPWCLYAPVGKKFKPEKDVEERLPYSMEPGQCHVFPTFDEAAEWAKENLGIPGWKRDRWGGYHPSETANDRACIGMSWRVCTNKRKPGETMCGVHLGVVRRDVEWKQKWADRIERDGANSAIQKDAIAAGEALGLKVSRSHGAHVGMHAEDFLALCRELSELRELREFV